MEVEKEQKLISSPCAYICWRQHLDRLDRDVEGAIFLGGAGSEVTAS